MSSPNMEQQSHTSEAQHASQSFTKTDTDGDVEVIGPEMATHSLSKQSQNPDGQDILPPPFQPKGCLFIRVRGDWGKQNMDVPYNPRSTFEDMIRKLREQLPNPEADISLCTEPVRLTSDNWKNYANPGLICTVKTHPTNALPPPPPPDPFGDSSELPVVRSPCELFEQHHGANVTLHRNRYRDQTVIVTRKQASESFSGGLGRVWKCLESAEGERWFYTDGSRVSGRLQRERRTIFLDTGLAFRGRPSGQVSKFCLVQESVLEAVEAVEAVPSDLSVSGSVNGTPIYRVRNFADAEEAKGYMLADATDLGIGTIGSYVVVAKGTKVDGLCRKEIGSEEVWI